MAQYNTEIGSKEDIKYMHDFYIINPKVFKDFVTFDNITSNDVESYICNDVENFVGTLVDIRNRLCDYIKAKNSYKLLKGVLFQYPLNKTIIV